MCHFGAGGREYLHENPCKGVFLYHFVTGYATPIPAQPAKGGLLSFGKSTHLPPELEKAAFFNFPRT